MICMQFIEDFSLLNIKHVDIAENLLILFFKD